MIPFAPLSSPAHAEGPGKAKSKSKGGAHGEPAPAGQGAGHEEGGEHGGGGDHGAHHYYTDDDDGDGVANWMDSTTGSQPNTETYVLPSLGLHAFNLLVLVAILAYVVRRPFGDFWRERALGIRKELTDAAAARDDATKRQDAVLERLQKIEAEVATMQATAEAEARQEEAQLVERARREAGRIAEQAERNVRDEVARARATLRRDAVDLAVRLAEATLRNQTDDSDRQALARAFLKSVDEGERRV